MKKYVMFSLAVMMMIGMSLKAQDQAPSDGWKGERKDFNKGEKHMMTPEQRADKLSKALDLTASEKAGVLSYFVKQDSIRHQQREYMEKIRKEMKAKFEASRKVNDEELAKVMGPEKFQKFKIMRAERVGEMKGRMEERMKERKGNHDKHENHPKNGDEVSNPVI